MSKYLDDTFDSMDRINSIAFGLQKLAEGFYNTGNEHVGNQLVRYSQDLDEATSSIRSAIGEETTRQLTEIQHNVSAILESLILPPEQAQ